VSVTAASFRTDFPEFANTSAYPDATVNFWLGIASKRMDPLRWGELLDPGIELYIAHNLALSRPGVVAAAGGGVPGAAGIISSKAVGSVSKSYDTSTASVDGAGNYNATTYGTRYYELLMMFGAGGVQF